MARNSLAWTPDEDAFLLAAWHTAPRSHIAAQLGRTPMAVEKRWSTIRPDGNHHCRTWTPEDDAVLLAHHHLSYDELATLLGRSWRAVQSRLNVLHPDRRIRRAWTPEEDTWLRSNAHRVGLPRLTKRLQRSAHAIIHRCLLLGAGVRQSRMEAGLSATGVARALGVNRSRVNQWRRDGYIAATTVKSGKSLSVCYEFDHILDFLEAGGALRTCLNPNEEWRDTVADIRAKLEKCTIAAGPLADLLHYQCESLYWWRMHHGFPAPTLNLGSPSGGYWYDRAEVRAWLNAHPQYWAQEAQAQL